MASRRPERLQRPAPQGSVSASPGKPDDRVCVAQIGAPHGIRGDVKLHAFTEDPMAVTRYGPLEAEDRLRRFEILAVRPAKGGLVARFAGIEDRDAAQRIGNVRLFVPRERLPALNDDETFYHADLIGLAAFGPDGAELGTVAAVHDFGAGDLLELKRGSGPSALVPFTKVHVPVVDVASRRVIVDMPDEFSTDLEDRNV